MLWKIYFWVLLSFGAAGYILLGFSRYWEVIDALFSFIACLGLFGFAWKKKIFGRFFWRFFLPLVMIWDIDYYLLLPLPEQIVQSMAGMSRISIAALSLAYSLPCLIALFIYAMRFDRIAERQDREPPWAWLAWWVQDPAEIDRQSREYATLPFVASARGISALLLIFSALATNVSILHGQAAPWSLADITVMLVPAYFILKGHRWAVIMAMVVWTAERLALPLASLRVRPLDFGLQLLAWTVAMHVFYLSYRIESVRVSGAAKQPLK